MPTWVSQGELDDALDTQREQRAEGHEEPEAGIDPQHLVAYMDEWVRSAFDLTKHRRDMDEHLWQAHENDMPENADKEGWQSKVVLNKPFTTAVQATSIVRRGVSDVPDFFEIEPEDKENPEQTVQADFWKQQLAYWADHEDVKLRLNFGLMAHFGFAIGQSKFLKLLWKPDRQGRYGLKAKHFEAWKQYDDPEREPFMPWSGLFNVHEEWVDLHELEAMAEQGQYINIDKVSTSGAANDVAGQWRRHVEEQREEERRKSGLSPDANKYRKPILVREGWGTVLDKDGRIAAKNVSYTTAGGQVIRELVQTDFSTLMRWPWVDFSSLPHPNKFHGYGLYEGVLAIWKLQCQLLNLYLDNENFRINNMFEVWPDRLRNPADDDVFPGKKWIRKPASEGPAIQALLKGDSNLADVQFIWAMATNLWENGSFVTEFVKGDQGMQGDRTATEVAQKTQQAMGVFGTIGRDTEDGLVLVLKAMQEMLQTYQFEMDRPAFSKLLQTNPLAQQIQRGMMPDQRMQAMSLPAQIRCRGVSQAFEAALIVQQLQQLAMVGADPLYEPYLKHFHLIRRYARELKQPDLVLTEQELQQQQQAQQQQMIDQAVQSAQQGALEKSGLEVPHEPPTPTATKPPTPRPQKPFG